MKERFGNLGLYLVKKAQDQIKEINRQKLFQKAEIRKKYIVRANDNYIKLRKNFVANYTQFLNNSLSSSLLNLKEKELDLKNDLIKDLINGINELIKEKISKDYSDYVKYILGELKEKVIFLDKPTKSSILFNPRDFEYFSKNPNKIKQLFKNLIEIEKAPNDFIGGFKIILAKEEISYDYSIDNLINKNSNLIQKEFFNIIIESGIKELERKFEDFIQTQKLSLEGYLKKYDRI